MELLFESRLEIRQQWGNLKTVLETPEVLPQPVLTPDHSAGEFMVQCLGTVLKDGGKYRMWYSSARVAGALDEYDGKEHCFVGYAESDDGVTWRRPHLGMREHLGTKQNNLVDLSLSSLSVFIDPESPASHRYRATGFGLSTDPGSTLPPGAPAGYYTAHSADGFHWKLDGDTPTWQGGNDNIISFYHPQQRRGIVMLKREPALGGIRRRGFWEAAYEGGKYGPDRCALLPDEYDDVCARTRGYLTADYYHMGFMAAGSATVGFLAQFRCDPPHHPVNPIGFFGAVDLGLMYQLEPQGRWSHFFGRPDFLTHGRYPWMGECVYPSSAVVEMGDYQGLYFTGSEVIHGYGYETAVVKKRPEKMREWLTNPWFVIGLARWRKNRLVGFRSDATAFIEMRFNDVAPGSQLRLNCRSLPAGRVSVEIKGPDRKTVARSKDLVGDHLDSVVQWEHGAELPKVEGPLQLFLHLDSATVYAFDIRPPGNSR